MVPSQLFQERPIWTRTAIYNQFNAAEVREIVKSVSFHGRHNVFLTASTQLQILVASCFLCLPRRSLARYTSPTWLRSTERPASSIVRLQQPLKNFADVCAAINGSTSAISIIPSAARPFSTGGRKSEPTSQMRGASTPATTKGMDLLRSPSNATQPRNALTTRPGHISSTVRRLRRRQPHFSSVISMIPC